MQYWAGGMLPIKMEVNNYYITIATKGNAKILVIFSIFKLEHGSMCIINKRIIYVGKNNLQMSNTIDYVTIASTGNALDFGDLLL